MTDTARPELRVIGVGNRDRGDDAVGPVVCDRLTATCAPGVRTTVVESGGVDLATFWTATDRVVVIDAMPPNGRPGRIATLDAGSQSVRPRGSVSTHAFDVGASIELARALDALPRELTVIGVEGAAFDFGAALSAPVGARIDDVVAQVIRLASGRSADR